MVASRLIFKNGRYSRGNALLNLDEGMLIAPNFLRVNTIGGYYKNGKFIYLPKCRKKFEKVISASTPTLLIERDIDGNIELNDLRINKTEDKKVFYLLYF